MSFMFDLVFVGVADAILLWIVTLIVLKYRLSLRETILVPFVCHLVMRVIALGIGDLWPGHPRVMAGAAGVIAVALLAECLYNILPGKAGRYSKPVGILIGLVVIGTDHLVFSPLAASLWVRFFGSHPAVS